MNFGFELVPVFYSRRGRFYSYKKDGYDLDEYRRLRADHQDYPEYKKLRQKLIYLASVHGFRRPFFKIERESVTDAPIYAPKETGMFRIFCLIPEGHDDLIIAGSGGIKNGGRFQEYPHLDRAYEEILYVWLRLSERLDQGGIKIVPISDVAGLTGNLIFKRETHDRPIPRRT